MSRVTKLLVANRGEIALRVMRACRELGIRCVAVYGEGEQQAPHVRYADEAWRIPSVAPLPYLDIEALLDVARRAGVDAVHPGYGFLAENPDFARACADSGLVFVGPPPGAIALMGDKVAARRVAAEAGVPVVPGTSGPVTVEEARAFGDTHGYPIAIKAAAGGGGRGFRVAWGPDEVEAAWLGASGEAERYFGNPAVYTERYFERPRHIEIQVFADAHGAVVALGERDCSIQRRHQKLIEEAPSPALDQETRARMCAAATRLACQVGYVNAGTVEFLYQDGEFYFLEMNTRIQVEHPVTEEITGIDLVKEQILVALGRPLSFSEPVGFTGHAIECRINAEDPAHAFAPAPGTVAACRLPAGFGVRVDGAVEPGYEVLPQYDSLLAKLVVWGRDRDEALARLRRALADFSVEGLPTTLPFHARVVEHPTFIGGDYDTGFLARHPEVLDGLEQRVGGSDSRSQDHHVGESYVVEVAGRRFDVRIYAPSSANPVPSRRARLPSTRPATLRSGSRDEVRSPIQGTVLRVAVEQGARVEAGALLCVIEAMKMENEITAPHGGMVRAVEIVPGQTVQPGALLVVIEPAGEAGSEAATGRGG
uniref:Acetyl-CoA carboxylase biotin carboxylase subunit n=1 Tax=Thermorudis peleae TaxID=1382356 RepID=A0A831T7E9_9BACT